MNQPNALRLRSLIEEQRIPTHGIIFVSERFWHKVRMEFNPEVTQWVSAKWSEMGITHYLLWGMTAIAIRFK